jgi:hypothetical protein
MRFRTMLRWIGGVVLMLMCVSFAQAGGAGPSRLCGTAPIMDLAGVQRQLDAAQALWQQRGPKEYDLTSSFKAKAVTLAFRTHIQGRTTGWVTAQLPPTLGRSMPAPIEGAIAEDVVHRYTVPGFFDLVRSTIRQARQQGACGVLLAKFDADDGHLRFLENNVVNVLDDEFSLHVISLIPLP